MKINGIKINAYGKLKNKEIELGDGINLIYGKNETGKSTILRFIVNSFYGVSKNKKGKEYSDYDAYMPWSGEEFSGKIDYELDDGNKFEVFRDFKKKNPKIFNEDKEDISKEFSIDKSKGNQFFFEQTKMDEDVFLSTIVSYQQHVRLEKGEQNFLIQKIANLIGTGEDNVSYRIAMDRLTRRQRDEIGSEKSREKPMNILEREITLLEQEKGELQSFEEKKYDIEENKNNLKEEIEKLELENNYLTDLKNINEKEKIEKEKINFKEKIYEENSQKILKLNNELKNKKNENKIKINKINGENNLLKNKNKKINKLFLILFFIILLLNISQIIFIKNIILNIILILFLPVVLISWISVIKIKNK